MTSLPETVCALGAELGEGPVWSIRDQALWFVDIKAPKIYRFDPQTRSLSSWDAPEPVGWLFPASDGAMIAGLRNGLHRFVPATGDFRPIVRVEPDRPQNRLNDAAVDRQGRIWFGTMDESEREASGEFYRYDRGHVSPLGLPRVRITNGPAL